MVQERSKVGRLYYSPASPSGEKSRSAGVKGHAGPGKGSKVDQPVYLLLRIDRPREEPLGSKVSRALRTGRLGPGGSSKVDQLYFPFRDRSRSSGGQRSRGPLQRSVGPYARGILVQGGVQRSTSCTSPSGIGPEALGVKGHADLSTGRDCLVQKVDQPYYACFHLRG